MFLVGSGGVMPVFGQAGAETTSFPVLTLDASARSAALAGATGASAPGDVNGLFYNPALLDAATHQTASLSYLNHLSDINAGTLAYSRTLERWKTTIGAGVRFVHWGTFDGRDAQGVSTGTFRAGDVALTLSVARALTERVHYGASVHVVHSGIETARATALAGDLGARYQMGDRGLMLSATVRNLSVVLDDFGPSETTLPADVRISASKPLAHLPLRLIVSAYDLNNAGTGVAGGQTLDHVLAHLLIGGELTLGEVLHLRAGYNHRRSKELALNDRFDLAGLNLGFGVMLSRFAVDYAYTSWSDIGGLHQFTVRAFL